MLSQAEMRHVSISSWPEPDKPKAASAESYHSCTLRVGGRAPDTRQSWMAQSKNSKQPIRLDREALARACLSVSKQAELQHAYSQVQHRFTPELQSKAAEAELIQLCERISPLRRWSSISGRGSFRVRSKMWARSGSSVGTAQSQTKEL